MCPLKWSYSGSHQGIPASESRTSIKPQTRVKFPLTTCISGFLSGPHVPCTMPRVGSPWGGGAAPPLPACPHSPGRQSARLGDRWGSRSPVQRTMPQQHVLCVVCPVSGTVVFPPVGCLPGRPSDPHEGRGQATWGRSVWAFPRETGSNELKYLTGGLTANMVCSKSKSSCYSLGQEPQTGSYGLRFWVFWSFLATENL